MSQITLSFHILHDLYWAPTLLISLFSSTSRGAKQFPAAQGKVNPLPSTSSELVISRRAEQIFFMECQENAVWASSECFQGTWSKGKVFRAFWVNWEVGIWVIYDHSRDP